MLGHLSVVPHSRVLLYPDTSHARRNHCRYPGYQQGNQQVSMVGICAQLVGHDLLDRHPVRVLRLWLPAADVLYQRMHEPLRAAYGANESTGQSRPGRLESVCLRLHSGYRTMGCRVHVLLRQWQLQPNTWICLRDPRRLCVPILFSLRQTIMRNNSFLQGFGC
eukprot:COSAG05_NODE_267_length_12595_cov_7.076905_10_plen_164_part_00